MTKDEIVTALRCCAEGECLGCTLHNDTQRCQERVLDAAADLIENQQRHIEALMQANAALRDTVLRRDAEIEKMKEEIAKLAADRKALINELCGKYKHAHEGACVGCRWREEKA